MSHSAYMIPGAALRRADVPLAALPAVRGVPADGATNAPLPGTALYQAAVQPYARTR